MSSTLAPSLEVKHVREQWQPDERRPELPALRWPEAPRLLAQGEEELQERGQLPARARRVDQDRREPAPAVVRFGIMMRFTFFGAGFATFCEACPEDDPPPYTTNPRTTLVGGF